MYQVLCIKYKKILFGGIFWFLILNTLYLILYTPSVRAEGLDLAISPPILKITATPPASIKAPISIQNLSENPVELSISFRLFKPSSKENGQVDFVADSENVPSPDPLLFKRVQVFDTNQEVTQFTLAPSQVKTLELRITLPENEVFADYYFSVLFISRPEGSEGSETSSSGVETSNTLNAGGVATNILLSIGPKGKVEGVIEEFSAPFFVEKGPVPFRVRIRNTGDHVITPTGGILIKNMFGQTIGKVELLPVNILSQSIRAVPDTLQAPESTPSASLITSSERPQALWPESFLLGPYSAKLTVALSPDGPVFSKTIYFIALPIQIVLGIITAILFTILVRNRLKNLSHRK